MNQARELFAQISAELDAKVPGWRSAHSNFDAAVEAAGDRAKQLTADYRKALRTRANATPVLPVPRVLGGGEVVRDKDVPVFDSTTSGAIVSSERRDRPGCEYPPETFSYDDDGEVRRARTKALEGREEDSLYHPEEPKVRRQQEPRKTIYQRVRAAIKYDWSSRLSFNPVAPRDGVNWKGF